MSRTRESIKGVVIFPSNEPALLKSCYINLTKILCNTYKNTQEEDTLPLPKHQVNLVMKPRTPNLKLAQKKPEQTAATHTMIKNLNKKNK